MNKYANTTTLKKEVDKGGLILTEPMEMGRYIGDVRRKIKIHSLSLDWSECHKATFSKIG